MLHLQSCARGHSAARALHKVPGTLPNSTAATYNPDSCTLHSDCAVNVIRSVLVGHKPQEREARLSRSAVLQNRGATRMKKSLVIMLLVFVSGTLVQQSAAQAAAGQPAQAGQAAPASQGQKKEIKNPAEYNAYVN